MIIRYVFLFSIHSHSTIKFTCKLIVVGEMERVFLCVIKSNNNGGRPLVDVDHF